MIVLLIESGFNAVCLSVTHSTKEKWRLTLKEEERQIYSGGEEIHQRLKTTPRPKHKQTDSTTQGNATGTATNPYHRKRPLSLRRRWEEGLTVTTAE
ncbi:hypothetical protein F2Q70_00018975 [Brassica cretica]|uniref:Uncharacterized protein n=1 Tax=Brassica cretica TaxID=69181 RepID=A0A8S9HP62_BRACR|nr:hypothetical protein F2Q70_00018975 [Brassica cretica]